MKIIKEGKLPTYRGECNVCGCVFEASHEEVEQERKDYEFTGSVVYYKCHCPCCGTLILVNKEGEE